MNQYRQGDVLLKPIQSIPEGAKKVNNRPIAYGEVTGHSHRFSEKGDYDIYELAEKLYLQVHSPSPLIHEEHNTLIIDQGIYEIGIEREYDYVDEELKTVVD